MAEETQRGIEFCTLGMFIIDEIHFPAPKDPVFDIVGGAGSYSALGARLFSPPPKSRSVGWIVDCGSDFPADLREYIDHWQSGCVMRETPDRLTTRGWNGYGDNEHRAFRYTTPKLRLDHDSLTPELLLSKSFHMVCSPSRCIELVTKISFRREQLPQNDPGQHPMFIWEPVPDLCSPEDLPSCLEALHHVDVISPNHQELAAFFGETADTDAGVDRRMVKQCVDALLASGIGSNGEGAVVVRAGKDGCYVATRTFERWLPAYHQSAADVIDPTGGGNTFLGGLAIGLVRTGSVEEAAIWGSIAASFAIEQIGMPVLAYGTEEETWNGVRVLDRLAKFKERLEQYVQP